LVRVIITTIMKKLLILFTTFVGFSAQAQQFESADDALEFLSNNFNASTYTKTGDAWTDPVELMFDINEINLFQYKGTISEKNFTGHNKSEVAKLTSDKTAGGILYFNWREVAAIDLEEKNDDYWITITGPVYNDKSELVGNSRTLYVANKCAAQQIKTALEDCMLEFGAP